MIEALRKTPKGAAKPMEKRPGLGLPVLLQTWLSAGLPGNHR
jgi:hypothetical protein